jgi:hypothetical protein
MRDNADVPFREQLCTVFGVTVCGPRALLMVREALRSRKQAEAAPPVLIIDDVQYLYVTALHHYSACVAHFSSSISC